MRIRRARPLLASLAFLVGTAVTALAAQRDERVFAAAEKFRADGVRLLERLVNIDSGTGHASGLDQVAGIVAAELEKLGGRVELMPAAPVAGKNVVATFTGSGKGRVLMIAHMDTVWPVGEAARRPFRIEGERAYGPGVNDNKSGVVTGIGALRVLHETGFRDFATVTFLVNCNEETGSLGTRQLMQNLARKHDIALNLESGRPGDALISARKGSGVIEVTVKGKASHAGNAPEAGRNAAMEAAHQMLQLARLADASKGTTINFTIIHAGDRPNVIPDQAVAHADVRVVAEEEFRRLERDLVAAAQNKLIPECEVTVKLIPAFSPFMRNAATDALIERTRPLYAEIERSLGALAVGGAADSSITSAVGTPTLDGLGIVGGGGHSLDEYMELGSVVPRVYLLARLVMTMGAGR
ncbi:MAG TPA: glutamate carboxypeptidase [Opitutaceae bacterium]|nr:glutamate carboxypeptidase [Opitutaceae bacterium]